MKFLLVGMLLCGIFCFTSSASASNVPQNVKVLEASDTTISLDWDDSEDVIGYYIYYGTQSGSGGSYEVEGIDLIEESDFIIEDLTPDTRYYMALVSVDDLGTESEKSDEVEHVTLSPGQESQAVNFRISDVKVIDDTSVELIFSTDLEISDGASREFIIENANTGEEINVDITDVLDGNPRNVIVVLGSSLEANTEYKVTVLDISDADGNTIESGIDAFINFETPVVFTTELESAGPEETTEQETTTPVIVEEEPEQQNQPVEETTTIPLEGNMAGTTISKTELSAGANQVAQVNKKLPQTGPEHWILAFIAFFFTGGLYYSLSRKQS